MNKKNVPKTKLYLDILIHKKYFKYLIILPIFFYNLLYIFTPFWYDESWRIMRIVGKDYLIMNNLNYIAFPNGIELISKITSLLFGNHEFLFRVPILIISLSVSAFFIYKWKNKIHIILLWILIIIFNFNYLFFSHAIQYKQLATDGVFFLYGLYILTKLTEKNAIKLTLILFLLNMFSFNIAFLFPFYIINIIFNKKYKKSTKTGVLLIILISIFITYLSYIDHSKITSTIIDKYWGDNFITIHSLNDIIKNLFINFDFINLLFIPQPSFVKNFFAYKFLLVIIEIFSIIFIVFGIKKHNSKIFTFSILSTIAILNILSYLRTWPMGNNRVNLFLFPSFFYLLIEGYIYIRFYKLTMFIFLSILFLMLTNSMYTISIYIKFAIKPLVRKGSSYTNALQIERVSDGMKCAVNEILKVNKPNDTIVLYHFLSEPVFGYYYWYHTWDKNYNIRVNPKNIYNNEDYAETSGKGYLPDRSENFFKEKLSQGNLYLIMIVGTDQEFANSQINRASKYGNLSKVVSCKGLVNSWHFDQKEVK